MDYLQTLEFKMAALQRKIRLLQDLRFFAETASAEELASFGDELRSVSTSSGTSLGSILAALLGVPSSGIVRDTGSLASAASQPRPEAPANSSGSPIAPVQAPRAQAETAAVDPGAAASVPRAAEGMSSTAPSAASGGGQAEALALIEASMKSIPACSFLMGSDAQDAEKPQHKVTLGAYRVCDHLITNKEYSLFVAANPQWGKDRADPDLRDEHYLEDWTEAGYPEGKEDHPVAFVSFNAALAFAAWVGKRLPTEAEWECSARGGLVGKKFPNGDQMNDKLANLAKQYRGTTPIRTFDPNGFGLYDMAGNLFEWCSDWYGPYSAGEAADPKGPGSGEYRVARGGSWMSGASALRVSARVDMEEPTCGQVGIRLVDNG
jgi:formylglycine-generating enzyme required for sulfatase activity